MHASHAVSPASSWNVPATHLAHEPVPTSGAIVPGLHGVGSAEPVEQNDPGRHVTQSSSEVIGTLSALSVLFWKRPDGQGRGALEPWMQKLPPVHSTQAVLAEAAWYFPGEHRLQVPLPFAWAKLPGRQSTQKDASLLPGTGLAFPAMHCKQELLLAAPAIGLYVPAVGRAGQDISGAWGVLT